MNKQETSAKSLQDIVDYCLRHKNIYCYGAGTYGRKLRVFLSERDIELKSFIVSSAPMQNEILGVPVTTITNMSPNDGILVGVSDKYKAEVTATLTKHNVTDYLAIPNVLMTDIDQIVEYRKNYPLTNDICILLYHRVANLAIDTWRLATKPHIFEEHIKFLKKHYPIIRFDDDWQEVKRPSVVLTFDDGYADIFEYALPILEKYNVPATIFVSTELIDSRREFWWDDLERIICVNPNIPPRIEWEGQTFATSTLKEQQATCFDLHTLMKNMSHKNRYTALETLAKKLNASAVPRVENRVMTSTELRRLSQSPCITIGAHTVTHSALSVEPIDLQMSELIDSKTILENITGQDVRTFSYPFGAKQDYTEETTAAVIKCNYKKVAAAYPGLTNHDSDGINVPRNNISQFDSLPKFVKALNKIWASYG